MAVQQSCPTGPELRPGFLSVAFVLFVAFFFFFLFLMNVENTAIKRGKPQFCVVFPFKAFWSLLSPVSASRGCRAVLTCGPGVQL